MIFHPLFSNSFNRPNDMFIILLPKTTAHRLQRVVSCVYRQTSRLCHLTRKDGSAGKEDYSLNGWVEPQSKLSIRAYT